MRSGGRRPYDEGPVDFRAPTADHPGSRIPRTPTAFTVPKKQAKSKYTADRGIPGAFEGETVTRRRFMVGAGHATGAIATSAILLPRLGLALGPIFQNHKQRWQPVRTRAALTQPP